MVYYIILNIIKSIISEQSIAFLKWMYLSNLVVVVVVAFLQGHFGVAISQKSPSRFLLLDYDYLCCF